MLALSWIEPCLFPEARRDVLFSSNLDAIGTYDQFMVIHLIKLANL